MARDSRSQAQRRTRGSSSDWRLLARLQPRFARARAALAIAYLSLGGKDQASLTQLAKTSAERALAADDEIAEAHAALGLVHMRRDDWTAAREQFDRALTLDANSAAALEGSGCLLVDAGRYEAARPLIEHAVQLQSRNIGARECLAYLAQAPASRRERRQTADRSCARAGAHCDSRRRHRHRATASLRGAIERRGFSRVGRSAPAGRDGSRPHSGCAAVDHPRCAATGTSMPRRKSCAAPPCAAPSSCSTAWRACSANASRCRCECCGCRRRRSCARHARFEQIVGTAGLPAFWQEYGPPDVCKTEPTTYGCNTRPLGKSEPEREP